jgi:hypothetical protein
MLTTIFVNCDDFCKSFLQNKISNHKKAGRKRKLTSSEVLTIMTYFHCSNYKTFKNYYTKHVQKYLKTEFPNLVSYNRFVELMQEEFILSTLMALLSNNGKKTGIYYIDSFSLEVCRIQREKQHKVFKDLAQKGKTSMGWFFGFKMHLVINQNGEIMRFAITTGNTSDKNQDLVEHLTQGLTGKLFGDKGYISNPLFKRLFSRGLELKTKVKQNMKNKLMCFLDRILLKKRGVIESVNRIIKDVLGAASSRHRSPINYFSHLYSSLLAYAFYPNKPSIKISTKDLGLLD